jgi:hypothetical protein
VNWRRFGLRIVLIATVAQEASARPPPPSPPAASAVNPLAEQADKKFEEGLAAMRVGRFPEACPLLEESYSMDPQPGALFTLAECESKAGKLVSAKARYEDYLRVVAKLGPEERTKQSARERIAILQRDALIRDIPTLTLAFVGGLKVPGGVKRNGKAAAIDGVATAVDPGKYTLEWTSVNGGSSTRTVTLALGGAERIEVPFPVDAPPVETKSAEGAANTATPKTAARSSGAAPFVVGGLALAAAGAGAVFGIMTLGKKSEVDAGCKDGLCTQNGLDAVSSGRTLGWVSTGAIALAGALTIASVVLFLRTPKAAQERSALGVYRF